jgi:serine/threonine-protein kinase
MNAAQQRRVRAVFDAVATIPPDAQDEFVRQEASGDPEVEQSVLRLLRASRSSEKFLKNPLVQRHDFSTYQGTRLGAYLVDRQIGEGGMGVVYRAMRADDAYKRVTALKIMRPEYKTPERIERFHRERQILAQLDHPNIARIIDGGATPNGLPYFVMDYVDGMPIDDFCNTRKADLNQRLNLFRQACMAVQYLHENRVIHRDLKPGNMLVTGSGTVKLLDFGIAKLLDTDPQTHAPSVAIASPGYASPEQLSGRPTGPASDIYSLGAILFELLTGLRPHDAAQPTVPVAMQTAMPNTIPKASASVGTSATFQAMETAPVFRKRLRGDLDSILLMTLRQEPEARYSSVAELSRDIENFQEGRPVAARKGAALYVISRFARRNSRSVAAAAMLLAALSWLGWDEWRLHELTAMMTPAQPASTLVSEMATPQGVARAHEQVQEMGRNFTSTFPKILKDPLAPRSESGRIVNQDLQWLDRIAPLAQQKPELATELGRTYLNVAEAQWSDDQASLNDPDGSLATCNKALGLLNRLSDAALKTEAAQKLEQDLKRQVNQLPATRP